MGIRQHHATKWSCEAHNIISWGVAAEKPNNLFFLFSIDGASPNSFTCSRLHALFFGVKFFSRFFLSLLCLSSITSITFFYSFEKKNKNRRRAMNAQLGVCVIVIFPWLSLIHARLFYLSFLFEIMYGKSRKRREKKKTTMQELKTHII